MDAAGTGDSEEDSRLPSQITVGGSGVSGGLLVVEGDETDAECDGAGGDGGDWDADDTKHVSDAEAGEGFGDEEITIDGGGILGILFRHVSH